MEHTDRWTEKCFRWVQHQEYDLVSAVTDDDAEGRQKFGDCMRMLTSGEADVLVVATSDYLPGDWVPRLEVAGDPGDPFAIPPANRPDRAPRQRRPRPARRTE